MTRVEPTSIKYYYYNNAGTAWVEITDYVNQNTVHGHWGMRSNEYTDRLAEIGELKMDLRNCDMTGGTVGYFDPDDANVLTGWAKNTNVKMVVAYDGVDYTRFYGKVTDINLVDDTYNKHIASVTVSDWMYNAYNKKIDQLSIATEKRGGYIVDAIVDAVGVTPQATSYSDGEYEFPAAFDSMTMTTTAATELNKVILSENGYFYCRHDKTYGETLVFETENDRNGLRAVSRIPVLTADSGYLLKEDGGYILTEGGGKIILDAATNADFNGMMKNYFREHGEDILNKITVTAYPKRVDATEQTIYSLGTPIVLSSNETKTITVKYQNASTKESCNAITSSCSQPVANTDYLMNTKSDGTGTDLTSSLTVSVTFYTAEAEVKLTNASGYTGYVTRLYLKGKAVYQDSPIKVTKTDSTSITAYGINELNITQLYQRDTKQGDAMAKKLLYNRKNPHTNLTRVAMIANISVALMFAFLVIDIGDIINVKETGLNIDDEYYVHGVDFNIRDGNVIDYSWTLSKAPDSLVFGSNSLIAAEFNAPSTDIITFGSIPALEDLPQQSMTIWAYPDSTAGVWGNLICTWIDNAGGIEWRLGYNETNGYRFYLTIVCSTSGTLQYSSYSGSMFPNNWSSLGLTIEGTTAKFYINGILLTTIIEVPAVGAPKSLKGANYAIGNIRSIDPPSDYHYPFFGKLADARHYNRILSDAEMAQIHSEGIGGTGVTEGLLFQAPVVRKSDLTYFTDRTLTDNDKIVDNISGIVSIQSAGVITRILP